MRLDRRRFLLTVSAGVPWLAGCRPDEDAEEVPSEPTNEAPEGLRLSIFPYNAPSQVVERFQPWVAALSKELGRPVRLHLATSYENQVRLVVEGAVDLALMGPASYVRARDRYADIGRVVLIAGGAPYQGAIVVRSDSPYETLSDLRNTSFAFSAHHSLSGHFAPRVLLREAGIDLADLRDYTFLDRHERVALAVLYGDFDAGAIGLGIASRYADGDPGLRVLATTETLPPTALVGRPGLSREFIGQLQIVLAGLTMEGFDSFVMLDDTSFDEARRMMAEIERAAAW